MFSGLSSQSSQPPWTHLHRTGWKSSHQVTSYLHPLTSPEATPRTNQASRNFPSSTVITVRPSGPLEPQRLEIARTPRFSLCYRYFGLQGMDLRFIILPASRICGKLHCAKSPHISKGDLLLVDNHPVCYTQVEHLHSTSHLRVTLGL